MARTSRHRFLSTANTFLRWIFLHHPRGGVFQAFHALTPLPQTAGLWVNEPDCRDAGADDSLLLMYSGFWLCMDSLSMILADGSASSFPGHGRAQFRDEPSGIRPVGPESLC